MSRCPECGCPFLDRATMATADVPRPWRDDAGNWYRGPARSTTRVTCAACGWNQTTEYQRGKLISTATETAAQAAQRAETERFRLHEY